MDFLIFIGTSFVIAFIIAAIIILIGYIVFRYTDRCCGNCKHCYVDNTGEGRCKICKGRFGHDEFVNYGDKKCKNYKRKRKGNK